MINVIVDPNKIHLMEKLCSDLNMVLFIQDAFGKVCKLHMKNENGVFQISAEPPQSKGGCAPPDATYHIQNTSGGHMAFF